PLETGGHQTILELDNVVRRFVDDCADDQVSFRVDDGWMTASVGGTGAGKPTTMRMIMGVLTFNGIEVRWNDDPVTAEHRRGFCYMPEERGLYPKKTVLSQLVYMGRLRGLSERAAQESAAGLLDRLSLGDKRDARLESLSLGNQQRVQIAAALIGEPRLLVLDEPF